MAIEFTWYIKGQVALATLHGDVTLEDLETGNATVSKWMEETDAEKVHVVFDANDMDRILFSVLQTTHTLQYLKHRKMGCFVVYGSPRFLKAIVAFLGGIINQLSKAQFHTAESLDEAMRYIREQDPSVVEVP